MSMLISIGLKFLSENDGNKEIEVIIPAINSRAPVVIADGETPAGKLNKIKESIVSQFNVWLQHNENNIDKINDEGAEKYAASPNYNDVNYWLMNEANIEVDKDKSSPILKRGYSSGTAGAHIFQTGWVGDTWTHLPAPSYESMYNDKGEYIYQPPSAEKLFENKIHFEKEAVLLHEAMANWLNK